MTEITYTPRQRIRFALGRMPYLPSATSHRTEFTDDESLAEIIERLADYLSEYVVPENAERERELASLRADVAAVRRIFGGGQS